MRKTISKMIFVFYICIVLRYDDWFVKLKPFFASSSFSASSLLSSIFILWHLSVCPSRTFGQQFAFFCSVIHEWCAHDLIASLHWKPNWHTYTTTHTNIRVLIMTHVFRNFPDRLLCMSVRMTFLLVNTWIERSSFRK